MRGSLCFYSFGGLWSGGGFKLGFESLDLRELGLEFAVEPFLREVSGR